MLNLQHPEAGVRRMRLCLRLSVCVATLIGGQGIRAQTAEDLHKLYETDQVFALRDAVEHTTTPLFYRAAVEASSNQIKVAEKDLRLVIDAAPHSTDAFEAHDLLCNMYFRNGMYRESFREIVAASQVEPDGGGVKDMLPILTALNELPEQIVAERKPSKLQMRAEDGGLFVPLKIDGKSAEYFLDTGSGISVSWSVRGEAARAGNKGRQRRSA
jgi:hypothetical protein